MFVRCFSRTALTSRSSARRVLADDHPLVDLVAGGHEQGPALLELEAAERGDDAAAVGDERAGRPRAQLAVPRLVAVEDVVQLAGAAGLGEELGAKADQRAGRGEVVHAHPAGAVVDHLLEPALAQGQQLGQDADVVLGHVDREALDRLVELAVDLPGDDLGLADGQLVTLAAHDLDEHRELELAAALDLPGVRPLGLLDAQRHVAHELGVEPVGDLARGQLVAVLAGQRRRVDPDRDAQRRLVDAGDRQRARVVGVGQRLADRHLGDAGHGDDVARPGLGRLDPVERLGHVELADLGGLDLAVAATPGDRLPAPDRPVAHPAQREAPDVGRGVEVRDQGLQRVVGVVLRGRDVLDQEVHQRRKVRALRAFGRATAQPALAFV